MMMDEFDKTGWGTTAYSVREVLHALNGSKLKWLRIYQDEDKDNGAENCPLCKLFLLGGHDGCNQCPIKKTTGRHDCGLTPWREWLFHQRENHAPCDFPYNIQCPQCKIHAKQCFTFVEQLHEQLYNLMNGRALPLGVLFKDMLVTPKLERPLRFKEEDEDAKHGN